MLCCVFVRDTAALSTMFALDLSQFFIFECVFVSESVWVYVCMLNGHSWDYAYHPVARASQQQEVTLDLLGVPMLLYIIFSLSLRSNSMLNIIYLLALILFQMNYFAYYSND